MRTSERQCPTDDERNRFKAYSLEGSLGALRRALPYAIDCWALPSYGADTQLTAEIRPATVQKKKVCCIGQRPTLAELLALLKTYGIKYDEQYLWGQP